MTQFDSGFLNEDFFGYADYVGARMWTLLDARLMLAPVGAKVASVTFGGRGTWYPVDPRNCARCRYSNASPRRTTIRTVNTCCI